MTDAALNTTTLETRPDLHLSPPPKSLGVGIAGLVVSSLTLLTIGVFASAGISNADAGSPAASLGWIFLTVGLVLGAIPFIMSINSLRATARTRDEVRRAKVLHARATASRARELGLTAVGISAALLLVVGFVLLIVGNDASVQRTFLNWDVMANSLGSVTSAFGLNILIAVIAEVIVLVFGLVLAICRMLPGKAGAPVRWLAIAYIDVMRAVPAIIVIYLIGFGLPLAGIPVLKDLSPAWFAIIALALTYSAYVAETYRSGIESIHPSQFSASRSLGFSFAQTMRFVILPQSIRNVIPPLLTMFIGLQKDTSLVNVIGAMDSFNQAKYISATNFNLSSVTVVAFLFVLVTIPQTRLVDWWLERGDKRRGGR
ncbi:amino acid ABC transporter permease [Gulosibacter bifidus]|uniref:Amino acid ABC transporter permease n=1 Tax=Gulosibacter bifidus TaxID=272239 RepID=A0ABW5RHK5_9MICO|nr:amino acid ABC transporter permease [Gulosibacter bifidus]